MKTIGVLDLQGAVQEHIEMLNNIEGVVGKAIKYKEDLHNVLGLIIPGGESTALIQLLEETEMGDEIRKKIDEKLPLWGTCAGMILLAKKVDNNKGFFQSIDISVIRNGYGRQIDSFTRVDDIPSMEVHDLPMIFIRAPYIDKVGDNIEVLKVLDNKIIAAKNDHVLVTSFHPEISDSSQVHEYFIREMVD